jgi:hypothetical protein
MTTSASTAEAVDAYIHQHFNGGGYMHPSARKTSRQYETGLNDGSFAVMLDKKILKLLFKGSAVAADGSVDKAAVLAAAAQDALPGVFEIGDHCSAALIAVLDQEVQLHSMVFTSAFTPVIMKPFQMFKGKSTFKKACDADGTDAGDRSTS